VIASARESSTGGDPLEQAARQPRQLARQLQFEHPCLKPRRRYSGARDQRIQAHRIETESPYHVVIPG
jgi:hypothetical protein